MSSYTITSKLILSLEEHTLEPTWLLTPTKHIGTSLHPGLQVFYRHLGYCVCTSVVVMVICNSNQLYLGIHLIVMVYNIIMQRSCFSLRVVEMVVGILLLFASNYTITIQLF